MPGCVVSLIVMFCAQEERIIKDIGRTFPELRYYCKPDVQTNLFSVLKAYSALDPDLGYW